jgi:prepilin-type N-terminal cleavage/methylation domain-containing protein
MTRRRQCRFEHGVTLIELMVVVVIAAILASLGTVTYRGYRRRSMASEAQVNIGLIATAQEAYRAEFGRYYSASPTASDYQPSAINCGSRADFTSGAGYAEWQKLGWRPEVPYVAFRYQTLAHTICAGPPAMPSWAAPFFTCEPPFGWFTIEATADLACGGALTTYRTVSSRAGLVAQLNEYQ